MYVYVVLERIDKVLVYRGSFGSVAEARARIAALKNPGFGPLPLGDFYIGSDFIEPEQGEVRLPCEHRDTREFWVDCDTNVDWCLRCGAICEEGEWRWPTYLPPSLEGRT